MALPTTTSFTETYIGRSLTRELTPVQQHALEKDGPMNSLRRIQQAI